MADPTCDLEVKIHCCSRCRAKARKKLKKVKGVNSVADDDTKRTMRVSGGVDPNELVKKFANLGKIASVLSFKEEDSTPQDKNFGDNAQSHSINGCFCRIHHNEAERAETDKEGNADSNEENEEDSNGAASAKNEKILTWKHPSLKKENTKKKTKDKKKSTQERFLDLMYKNDNARPHFQSPMMMYGGLRMPNPHHHPCSTMAPPHPPMAAMPCPYGGAFWPPPWEVNPMVRYASYADNYTPTFRGGTL